jgi:hypothetical protein
MTLFSSDENHENPYSELHGQNVVYAREFRKNRSLEGYTFLAGVNFSMCRENVWYLQGKERLDEILVLHQGVQFAALFISATLCDSALYQYLRLTVQ